MSGCKTHKMYTTFFTIYKQIEQPTGGGGEFPPLRKMCPKGKIKPKKGGKFPSLRKMGPKGKSKCVQKMKIRHI